MCNIRKLVELVWKSALDKYRFQIRGLVKGSPNISGFRGIARYSDRYDAVINKVAERGNAMIDGNISYFQMFDLELCFPADLTVFDYGPKFVRKLRESRVDRPVKNIAL